MKRLVAHSEPIHSTEEWVIAAISLILALGNILLGWILIFSAPTRFSGPSYAQLRDIAPAAAWGAGFLMTGLLALVGQIWRLYVPARLGHGLAAIFCLIFTVAFLISGLPNKAAGLTGVAIYLTVGVVHALITLVSPPQAKLRF